MLKFLSLLKVSVFIFCSVGIGGVSSLHAQAGCTSGADYVALATAKRASQELTEAVHALNCVLTSNPQDYSMVSQRMEVALLDGQYGLAVRDANTLRDFSRQQFDQQLADYNMELTMSPNDETLLTFRSFIHWSNANDNGALNDLEHLLSVNPNSSYGFLFRGSSLQYMGDILQPADDFADAIRLDPNNTDVYSIIGSTYTQTGNYALAVSFLQQAIAVDPNNARAHYFMGMAQNGQFNTDAAFQSFSQSLSIDSTFVDAYYDRGLLFAQRGDFQSALNDFNQIVSVNPAFRQVYSARGAVYEHLGDMPQAVLDFENYIELSTIERIQGEPLIAGIPQNLPMTDGRTYIFEINVMAGQTLQVTASSQRNTTDPLVLLLDANQTPLTGSDDAVLGDYSAQIDGFTIPADGTYTLILTHSTGGFRAPIDLSLSFQ